jgi:phosphomannomutase
MKKVIAFDLDGTLAPSKSPLPERMGELLDKLLDKFQVCVISGGKFEQFEKQLLSGLHAEPEKLARLHIMPTCGTRYYKYDVAQEAWQKVYAEDFTEPEKQKIMAALEKGMDELDLREEKIYGEIIEDRGSQVTLSVLGQDIVDALGLEGVRIKEEWDPDNQKKEALRKLVAPSIPEFEIKVGGLTSVDVTKPGIDKAYGMKRLAEALAISQDDILFIGDRLGEGGNDYPVKAMGIDSLEISSWQETAVAVQAIIYAA